MTVNVRFISTNENLYSASLRYVPRYTPLTQPERIRKFSSVGLSTWPCDLTFKLYGMLTQYWSWPTGPWRKFGPSYSDKNTWVSLVCLFSMFIWYGNGTSGFKLHFNLSLPDILSIVYWGNLLWSSQFYNQQFVDRNNLTLSLHALWH